MKIYFDIDNEGFLNGWGSTRSSESEFSLTLENNHEFFKSDVYSWKYVDGEIFFDEEKNIKVTEQYEKEKNKLSVDDLNTLALFELAQEIEMLRQENQRLIKGGVKE